ncbi:MAG TPA: Hsp20/alpha crystallin family protein [Aggregatilinea sp.]|jgi:HSP20 family protein|uniref:Hsp20/alpha crystallin family protein n=1 Tax=Aggregatilinea sp. TaxID=2806333 RepID=UPI002C3B99F3|nr:Hsp20/alpha crystallin family protein [Aggregatilinea sp.]HML22158.1 Hsp20/alpha crystallin family protein [Aggregatilinea sp.]
MVQRWVIVRHASSWYPPTDVYEQGDHLVVVVEVAGMRDSDFSVVLHGDQLVISGARQRTNTGDCAFHQLEIPFGEFRTEVTLPWTVERNEVTATYRDGFLRIEMPRIRAQHIQIVNTELEEVESAGSSPTDPEQPLEQ